MCPMPNDNATKVGKLSSRQISNKNVDKLLQSNWLTDTALQVLSHPSRLQLSSFCTHRRTFASDCLKARFDASDRTARTTCFTLKKVQSCVFL